MDECLLNREMLNRRHVQCRPVACGENNAAVSEAQGRLKNMVPWLEKAIELSCIDDGGTGNTGFHPATNFRCHTVAKHPLHAMLGDAVQIGHQWIDATRFHEFELDVLGRFQLSGFFNVLRFEDGFVQHHGHWTDAGDLGRGLPICVLAGLLKEFNELW